MVEEKKSECPFPLCERPAKFVSFLSVAEKNDTAPVNSCARHLALLNTGLFILKEKDKGKFSVEGPFEVVAVVEAVGRGAALESSRADELV